jgi:uncharacterized protein YabE (DUF348 family)
VSTPREILAQLHAAARRPAVLVLNAVVLVALLAGGIAWAATGKTVAVAVDGQPRDVDFRGDTVGDALAAAGLTVGEHDVVVPALDSEVEDGDRVALRRGRQLQLVVDGVPRTVWVTATSVDEALAQVGLDDRAMALSASRSRRIPLEGLALDVRLPKTVTLTVDGATGPRTTTAATVADLLTEAGVVLGATDRVSVPTETAPTEGLVVVVTRVTIAEAVEDVAVPFAIERRNDAGMLVGQSKVITPGRKGLVRKTFSVETVDGKVADRRLLGERQVQAPVTQVIAVGTKPKPKPTPKPKPAPAPARSSGPRASTAGADGLNWAALARCESGGNPRAVSPNGLYHGLYQFASSTWRSVGGSGQASQASADEQTYRAKLLYQRSGRSPWPHCGRFL